MISVPLAVILIAAFVVCSMFDNTIALFTGGTFWELEKENNNAVYYKSDFATEEERVAKGAELVKQVEAEGTALLTNDRDTLPLATGAKVSLFSTSSVKIVYGGTGSANVDSSKCDNLKVALEKAGFKVNQTLWDFYDSGDAAIYTREDAGATAQDSAETDADTTAYGAACIIPMIVWAITLLVMKEYTLTGSRMKEIQAINAARKEAIAKGMTLEEAMKKYQTIQDVE